MSRYRKGLVLSIEQEEEELLQDPETGGTEAEVLAAQIEVADQAAEIQADEIELEELGDSIDTTEEAVEDLEAIKGTMEESVESGEGLTEEAAEIAEIAIESICRTVGIHDRVMLSKESFGTKGRLAATKLSIEQTEGAIARIKESIKKAVQWVIDFVSRLWSKITGSLPALKRYIDSLKKNLEQVKDDVPSKPEFENSTMATNFAINGKADASTVKEHLKSVEGLIGKSREFVISTIDQLKGFAEKGAVLGDTVDLKVSFKKSTDLKEVHSAKEGDETAVYYGNLYGGKSVRVTEKSIKVTSLPKSQEVKSISAAGKADVQEILDNASAIVEALIKNKKSEAEFKKAGDAVIAAVNASIKGDAAEGNAGVQKVASDAQKVFKETAQLNGAIGGQAFGALRGAATYANDCIKNLGGASAAKPAEDKAEEKK